MLRHKLKSTLVGRLQSGMNIACIRCSQKAVHHKEQYREWV